MPNVKLYIDADLWTEQRANLMGCINPLRTMLCRELRVPVEACQIAFVPCFGPPDQPQVNVELSILPAPFRTREKLEQVARDVRQLLHLATGATASVRIASLDPLGYVALK